LIVFENVTAKYPEGHGIFNLSFSIDRGEIVFLMGPTGSGKSTVLKCINKEIEIESGKVLINGDDISKIKNRNIGSYRRNVGMIFQDYKLLTDRDIFDNIAIPLQIDGMSSNTIRENVEQIAQQIGLFSKLTSLPINLSGGEMQRVAIARALIKNPSIILADEPTGNLDPAIADEILDIIELATVSGASVLMTTHNFHLIKPRKKRFIELSDGRLV
tara:strand:- start:322 stop:969 length:648 start_codon:yes stop_codon:yes gene_type:complete